MPERPPRETCDCGRRYVRMSYTHDGVHLDLEGCPVCMRKPQAEEYLRSVIRGLRNLRAERERAVQEEQDNDDT